MKRDGAIAERQKGNWTCAKSQERRSFGNTCLQTHGHTCTPTCPARVVIDYLDLHVLELLLSLCPVKGTPDFRTKTRRTYYSARDATEAYYPAIMFELHRQN
jgi:hypothetical protein